MLGTLKLFAALAATASLTEASMVRRNDSGAGIALNTSDASSIKQAASTVVYNMLKSYYVGNVTAGQAGLLPEPFFWWQAGAMFGGLIDYWAYTGDNSYTAEIGQAIVAQSAPTRDFNMPNEHYSMGNDDQGFWALTAMSALEEGLPVPAGAPDDLWYELTNNCFNDFVSRWNVSLCGGGLRWQVFPSNTGYDYKNTVANGVFMQLAARLSRYTGNSTYGDWAGTVFSWLEDLQLIDTTTWLLADGAHVEDNCTDVDHAYWSYSPAIAIYTAAVMRNISSDAVWDTRLAGILNATAQHFFSPYSNATAVMFEPQCEEANACDTDQLSFKAYLSRWLGKAALLLPQLAPQIQPLLEASAQAAAQACSGSSNHTCGTKWYVGGFDGMAGLGQYMSAHETFQSLLVFTGDAPLPGTADGVSWGN